MKAIVLVLLLLTVTAYALETCPGGVVIPSTGGVFSGNTCGEANGYTPQNAYQQPALGAPDLGGVIMMPPGPFSIALTANYAALAEVRDITGRTDCNGGVYAFARWPTKRTGFYTGFDTVRALQIVVDGQYRGRCGDFSLTITPTPPD